MAQSEGPCSSADCDVGRTLIPGSEVRMNLPGSISVYGLQAETNQSASQLITIRTLLGHELELLSGNNSRGPETALKTEETIKLLPVPVNIAW